MNFATYLSLFVILSCTLVFTHAGVFREILCDSEFRLNPCKRCVCYGNLWKTEGSVAKDAKCIRVSADQAASNIATGMRSRMEACPADLVGGNSTAAPPKMEIKEFTDMLTALKLTINSVSRQLTQNVDNIEAKFQKILGDTENQAVASVPGTRANVTKSVTILGPNWSPARGRLMTVNVAVQVDTA